MGTGMENQIITIYTMENKIVGDAIYQASAGVWYFDFPKRDTNYIARWDGGSANIKSPYFSQSEGIVGGGIAAVSIAGVAALIVSADTSTETPAVAATEIPLCEELNGTYNFNGSETVDTCNTDGVDISGTSLFQCSAGRNLTIQARARMVGRYRSRGDITVSGRGSNYGETFNGTARKTSAGTDGSIVVRGELIFDYDNGCQTVYQTTFSKQ